MQKNEARRNVIDLVDVSNIHFATTFISIVHRINNLRVVFEHDIIRNISFENLS